MIDYLKIKVKGCNVHLLLTRTNLSFFREFNEKTGEVKGLRVAEHHACKIKVFDSGTVIFSGSIHKMYNSIQGIESPNKDPKGYNGNQFYFHEMDFVIKHLTNLFRVQPSQMIIQNIEFGVNLKIGFDPKKFITGLLFFEGKPFEFQKNRQYAQSVHGQYIIKIYNKSNQYGMSGYILRFEIKVLKMEHQYGRTGIKTLAGIDHSALMKAFAYLLRQFDKVIYYDKTIREENLRTSEKINLKDYSNIEFWCGLESKKRDWPKRKLSRIISNHSENLKAKTKQKIIENSWKFDRLSEDWEKSNTWKFDYSIIVSDFQENIFSEHTKTIAKTTCSKEKLFDLSWLHEFDVENVKLD